MQEKVRAVRASPHQPVRSEELHWTGIQLQEVCVWIACLQGPLSRLIGLQISCAEFHLMHSCPTHAPHWTVGWGLVKYWKRWVRWYTGSICLLLGDGWSSTDCSHTELMHIHYSSLDPKHIPREASNPHIQ